MGSAAAAELAALGAGIVLIGRDGAKPAALAEDLSGEVSTIVADVLRTEAIEEAAHGALDHVVVAISAGASVSSVVATSSEAARRAFTRYWIGYDVLHVAPKVLRRNSFALALR